MKKIFIISGLVLSNIAFAFAAPLDNLIILVLQIKNLVGILAPLGISVAIVSLFYGIVMFMWKGQEKEEEHKKWMHWMGYSLLAVFVMVSLWGIVGFFGSAVGIGQGGGGAGIVPYIP